ncbi:hypothetical protein EZV62_013024 [Acer yangbiense]|uniref:Uncharacterized protein n=1 Tax=Acer yangbiense TaxID=1000413 RepID=A0A5C7HX08_9ROSI|nr:hypothetical protein EZV62_013024 [Acer yangbiense]
MSMERHASSTSPSPEDNAMFLDILHEAPLFGHRKSRSIFGSVVYFIVLAGYAILAAGAPWIFRPIQKFIPPLLCSCDVILLAVTVLYGFSLILFLINCPTAYVLLRCQGYYSFSQKLKHIVRLPFAITAYGTAAMLLVMVWKPQIGILSISTLLRIIMFIEAICAGSFMSAYISYVHQYNSLNSQPDVLNSLYSPLQPSSSLEGLRYHDGGRLSDQQMALLQYQRENLHFLSEEFLTGSKLKPVSDELLEFAQFRLSLVLFHSSLYGPIPDSDVRKEQVFLVYFLILNNELYEGLADLAHLLAARDQELRTLSAEMNQLQSELSLARSLIAERESEVQRVRNTNNQLLFRFLETQKLCLVVSDRLIVYAMNASHEKCVMGCIQFLFDFFDKILKQYVEENERLRAILGEWSTRAAKLERALEVEQMSNLELQKKISTYRNQRVSYESNEQGGA